MATALVPDALWSLADYFRPEGSTATELGPLHVPIVPMSVKAPGGSIDAVHRDVDALGRILGDHFKSGQR